MKITRPIIFFFLTYAYIYRKAEEWKFGKIYSLRIKFFIILKQISYIFKNNMFFLDGLTNRPVKLFKWVLWFYNFKQNTTHIFLEHIFFYIFIFSVYKNKCLWFLYIFFVWISLGCKIGKSSNDKNLGWNQSHTYVIPWEHLW